MKIVVIGAGLGGLTTAYVLARQNHTITVLEQHPSLSARGGGMMVRPNASRFALSWGLGPEFDAIADESPTTLLRNLRTGRLAVRRLATDISQFPDWGVKRDDMMKFLYRRAVEAGAKVEFGARVVDFVEGERGVVILGKNGKSWEADFVVAADGIRSQVRRRLLEAEGMEAEPAMSRSTHYGIEIPVEELRKEKDAADLLKEPHLTVHLGKEAYVTSRLHVKQGLWLGLFSIHEDPVPGEALWNEEGDIVRLRSLFSAVCPSLRAALGIAERCDRWKIAEVPDLPHWTSKKGFIIILGDAAHPMHPTAAQGFSQTIEDIAVLEHLLRTRHHLSVPSITRYWESIRQPRVEKIKLYAYANMQLFSGQLNDAVLTSEKEQQENKSAKSLKGVTASPSAPYQSAAFLKWVLDYNAVKEAKNGSIDQEKPRL
ncbi:FAD/NAD(P)-binding domain-containing protein [Corynespora cassiicola Philippines]|uniref:FAD/NAD(P)-binding domain-containing protein n=1 Tax=Corynespora cassiicola Philippines TaxID=1448308 RepID=A0A2T2PDC0_CORCC|nr:FAD/NAD(P)-binding domain-containing protein [Corynespora cassiicola Philippines]